MATPRIVVVGGGISGLSVAYRLRQRLPSAKITVLERQAEAGGNIRTVDRDGFRVECGPNGLFDAKPSGVQLCRDLGLGDQLIPGSEVSRQKRWLFIDGKMREVPATMGAFLVSRLLSWRAKWRLLTEKHRARGSPAGDETVAAFARRRAGDEVARILADAGVTGIHAGDPELLSVAAAFPRLVQFEREHGSVGRGLRAAARTRRAEAKARGEAFHPPRLWSFRGGLRVLVEALRDQLGASLVTGCGVRRLERSNEWTIHGDGRDRWSADAVVLAAPAHEQAELVEPLDSGLALEMWSIPYNRIAVVALGYRLSDLPAAEGFGYIAPQAQRRDVLGVQWCSSIFPERAPAGFALWRALCGGWHRGDVVDRDDDGLVAAVREELRQAMGVTAEPMFRHVHRWPAAIPQYHVGHLDRVRRIEEKAFRLPGLFPAGNAYHGVALTDCADRATTVADRVAAFVEAGPVPA